MAAVNPSKVRRRARFTLRELSLLEEMRRGLEWRNWIDATGIVCASITCADMGLRWERNGGG